MKLQLFVLIISSLFLPILFTLTNLRLICSNMSCEGTSDFARERLSAISVPHIFNPVSYASRFEEIFGA
jgi:hypothetical protein